MDQPMSTQEQQLCEFLRELPNQCSFRFTQDSERELITSLFWSLAGGKQQYMKLFFPNGLPSDRIPSLKDAQGAADGTEYTEAARGKACGHIFKPGEASYHCRTCSVDDTCCLCSKCFEATDHTGHVTRFSISAGNSGCCDCGDLEAWKMPLSCSIHTLEEKPVDKGKGKVDSGLPADLITSMRMTIGRMFDFILDVISCSPEQLRQVKTVESVLQDERSSRLSSIYGGGDVDEVEEYCVLLWNDEKHTVHDVQHQVARACSQSMEYGLQAAQETDSRGRCMVMQGSDLEKLLEVAAVLEQIRVTVTIRSARDTFREQMCGAIVQWMNDISGCAVGSDNFILRRLVCEELMKPWTRGSPAAHAIPGKDGLFDEEKEEGRVINGSQAFIQAQIAAVLRTREATRLIQGPEEEQDDDDDMDDDQEDEDNDVEQMYADMGYEDDDDVEMVDAGDIVEFDLEGFLQNVQGRIEEAREMTGGEGIGEAGADEANEVNEATMAEYPRPPPPPPAPAILRNRNRDRELTPSDSDTAEPLIPPMVYAKSHMEIPKTLGLSKEEKVAPAKPGAYWLGTPADYVEQDDIPLEENIFDRVRLDWLVLFDVRMWKKARIDLRSLYIATVVAVPEFKRLLGLRFAGVYTTLAQLYLVGDREPDHSIIDLSLQILTTPSVTAEVVERGNFLTIMMAILYTFLTTRQVGYPWDVSPSGVLAFDTGSVTNRRMYHFFLDLKYLMANPHVQEKLRNEERYIMQFLDLVKLHQGICPNVRAVGEHIEYEADGWIGASLIMREINRLCRAFSDAFRNLDESEESAERIAKALRLVAKSVIVNSTGAERHRFQQAEIKDEVKFKTVGDFEFEGDRTFSVVRFVVEEQPISFHHALHYTLSYLVECAKSMPVESLRALLTFTQQDLAAIPRSMGKKSFPSKELQPEDFLMAAFDYPLRVCAWLAQMKAGMWVRNGLSLRHQAGTYRGVVQRDVSHHRDIFLLQTALVVCDPSRVLASIVERFGMEKWVKGLFEQKSRNQDDTQHLDVVEDMVHLLIVLLSDRTSLMQNTDGTPPHLLAMRRDLIHVLCFKPMSFSDIGQKLPDKFQEHDDFPRLLEEMTTFKAPEGLTDVGTFELKPEYVEEIDPYIAHYNKNQREEAELSYRKIVAKKTGKAVEDVVYEPKLRPITAGAFAGLANCTKTGMFAQIIYYSLLYPLIAKKLTPDVPFTRVETFLQVVLHLILLAIAEEDDSEAGRAQGSFTRYALSHPGRSNFMPDHPQAKTIVALLNMMATQEDLKACHPKINLILHKMRQKQPFDFDNVYKNLGLSLDRMDTASPAAVAALDEQKETKRKAALARQAKVMAQMQQQQKSFMAKQTSIDWGDVDIDEDEEFPPAGEHKNFWKYPTGTCLLCQEDTDDHQLYGSFAYFMESNIMRTTNLRDDDFVREAYNTPENLDRSAEAIRPFGVAHENRHTVTKVNRQGETVTTEQQGLAKGFPSELSRPGPVSIGCGHVMHYSCFEEYFKATIERQKTQIARHQPEDIKRLEFICPLCKALGNAFLPVVWKGKEEAYPGAVQARELFDEWLYTQMHSGYYVLGAARPTDQVQKDFANYTSQTMTSELGDHSSELLQEAWASASGRTSRDRSNTPFSADSNDFDYIHTPATSSLGAPTASSGSSSAEGSQMVRDLVAAYRRLRDTFMKNDLPSLHYDANDAKDSRQYRSRARNDLCGSDVLARAVGTSIAAVEIQQRGVEAEYGLTFLDKIPEQVLTHLRLLSETTTSYTAVGGLRDGGATKIDAEFRADCERQHCQLFAAQYADEETDLQRKPLDSYSPLLMLDPFLFLCQSAYGVVEKHGFEIAHVLRLCYLAELTRVVYFLRESLPDSLLGFLEDDPGERRYRMGSDDDQMTPSMQVFTSFFEAIVDITNHAPEKLVGDFTDDFWKGAHLDENWAATFDSRLGAITTHEGVYRLVRNYALTFLRKCVVFMYVKYGVDFNSHVSPIPEQKELERLTEALRLPSFDDMLASVQSVHSNSRDAETSSYYRLVQGWITHYHTFTHTLDASVSDIDRPPHLREHSLLAHPGIPELIGLPKNYGTLIELYARKTCPSTGQALSDPMICLFCGDIFCGQGICCSVEVRLEGTGRKVTIGGANQHIKKCQGTIGLFISIRRCAVFMLYRGSGSFANAPYIDKYGEMDMGLRHGRELFLHQKRYDIFLRNMWLSHGIPSFVARKLEAELNNGGWETL